MRNEYTVGRVRDVFSGTFECRACGLEAPATVHAAGRGSAQGHGAGAASRALGEAVADANGVAARTLTFYPCPACGAVDASSRSYRIQVILGALVLGAVVAGGMWWLLRATAREGMQGGYGPIAAAIGGVVSLALYGWWGRPWRRVARRVEIDMQHAVRHSDGGSV